LRLASSSVASDRVGGLGREPGGEVGHDQAETAQERLEPGGIELFGFACVQFEPVQAEFFGGLEIAGEFGAGLPVVGQQGLDGEEVTEFGHMRLIDGISAN
jgi:hypothetical protein